MCLRLTHGAPDRGRIMVSTFRLREHLGTHPVATLMMRDLIARATRKASNGAAVAEPAPFATTGMPPGAANG